MNLEFKYNLKKDAENFIAVAKLKKIKKTSSFLKEKRFFIYKLYFEKYNRDFNKDKLIDFIKNYINENKIDVNQEIKRIKSKWFPINRIFLERAEEIFKTKLPQKQITAYLTVSDICGYNINDCYFFITLESQHSNLTIMHELWHFYTWEAYGKEFKKKNLISKEQYYDIKESLTEILNIEFKDLLGNIKDKGYLSHQEIRKRVRKYWSKKKDIQKVVENLLK
ncbi:hypothetical protein KKG58_05785 [Patescibacteria group bacterium]|nr:hypothetical protein [Patescibacteria group bacterium]